jgi:hypothetical protein
VIFSNPEIGLFKPIGFAGVAAAGHRGGVGTRLHDLGRTGWWLLVPLMDIGITLLLIWDCMKGTTGPNHFGPYPPA